jgi:uncharacterized protein (DUF2062 family)
MGLAIGVFIGATPTIPFHTVLAVAVAFLLRASKPAAAIGVWFSNPITIPFLYMASYKSGRLILGNSIPYDLKYDSILELAQAGMDVTLVMLTGGIVIGILPAIVAYVAAKKIFIKIRLRKVNVEVDTPIKPLPRAEIAPLHKDDPTTALVSADIAAKQRVSLYQQNEIL